ncbi:MAG TPA: carbohydrate ABC transporter permease [Spirochaetales bacterium]|jgi:raffinose/stachyose/melibiose transport system permease protein|nr:carbohydrate ABC transporter permease [Spirochaetales bacterium]HPS15338.1 carbohydrate ABC transporter permease [Spirochaetales bacterium]
MKQGSTIGRVLHLSIILLLALFVFAPFYVQIIYSLKTPAEVAESGIAFPTRLYLGNYVEALENTKLMGAFLRTLLVTVTSVLVLQCIAPVCAWVLVRQEKRRFYNFQYYLYLSAIMLPFQVVMLPLYSFFRQIGLLNTIPGLIIGICGFQLPYNVFVTASFVKTVPISMEEAARIDGASVFSTYWRVVFPLLKPITITTLILNTLSAWNDFQITVVLAFKENVRTLQYALYMFFGQYSAQIHQAFAAFLITMLPVIILYLALQKYLIQGLTAGAIKE